MSGEATERSAVPIVRLDNVSKRYGGVQALCDVDLTLTAGEVHCLAGENGSGKSTLVKIISGVEHPEKNSVIEIDGERLERLTTTLSTNRGIQVIYQDLALFPNLSVADNISFLVYRDPLKVVVPGQVRENAAAALARIGANIDLDREVKDLSIAERQIVAICRALNSNARLIIMDEPTASLNPREIDALLRIVKDLKNKGMCIVFVSHKLEEVLSVSDRVTVLRDGRKVGTTPAEKLAPGELSRLMTGRDFQYDRLAAPASGEKVLSVRNLTRTPDFWDITFDISEGEIVGLTGAMGAGKTELAHALFGMTQPDSGAIEMNGTVVRYNSCQDAIAHGVAYVPEDRLTLGLVMPQSIGANIVVSIYDRIAGLFGVIPPRQRKSVIDRWVDDLAIKTKNSNNAVNTLSGGNQQRVVLAKWMARRPRLLILDSPTVGVDVNAKDGIYAIVKGLAADGVAVLLISDEIPEVFFHTHRILVMRDGRLTRAFAPGEGEQRDVGEAVYA